MSYCCYRTQCWASGTDPWTDDAPCCQFPWAFSSFPTNGRNQLSVNTTTTTLCNFTLLPLCCLSKIIQENDLNILNSNNVKISKYLSRAFIQKASPTGILSYKDQLVFSFSSNLSLTVKGKKKLENLPPPPHPPWGARKPGLPHFPRENYKSLRPRITVVTAVWNHVESVKTKTSFCWTKGIWI